MPTTTPFTQADLFNAALALPFESRIELAERLMASVDPPPGVWCIGDPGFDEELNRRWAAYKAGEMEAIDFEVVVERIRKDLERSRTT
jgi:putative addiction module component (TIGR02574 family)